MRIMLLLILSILFILFMGKLAREIGSYSNRDEIHRVFNALRPSYEEATKIAESLK